MQFIRHIFIILYLSSVSSRIILVTLGPEICIIYVHGAITNEASLKISL